MPQISREQLLAAGGTLLASGAIDLAVHFNPAVVLAGIFTTYAVGKLTPEVVSMLVPGSNPDEIIEALEHVAGPVAAPHANQRVGAKLKRLVGIKTPTPVQPKDAQDDEPEQPDPQQELTKQRRTNQAELAFNQVKHRDCLNLGYGLYPHADTFLSGRVTILGMSGSGKSNTLAVLIEALGPLRVPFLLCDTEGEYEPLCTREYLYRPLLVNATNITIKEAYTFGQRILDEGLQVVLSLDSFDDDDTAALIMIDIIRGMRAWQEALPNEERVACAVILDEAQVWLPENEAESAVSRVKDTATKLSILNKLQQTFFNVVRRGRKRGIGFIFATQKLAEIDNRCLQSDWKICHRQEDSASLARYKEMGIEEDIAMALANGEAWIKCNAAGLNQNYQIRRRTSPHGAITPGLKSVQERYNTGALNRTPLRTPVRPAQEPSDSHLDDRYGRNVTVAPEAQNPYGDVGRNGRNAVAELASDTVVTPDMSTVPPPSGWDAEKLKMLPGFYRVFNSLDKCLDALELSTSQRNRDFAREQLKLQGIWKDQK